MTTNEERAKAIISEIGTDRMPILAERAWFVDEITKALDAAEQRTINDCIAALEKWPYRYESSLRILRKLLDAKAEGE